VFSSGSKGGGGSKGSNLDPETRAAVQKKLPDDWDAGRPNRDVVGTRWDDPSAPKANGVRVDKGIPDSSWPSQRVDHVVVRHNGRIIGRDGRPIEGRINQNPDAHIPLSEWLKWGKWWGP
jgi:hypothetical protein